MGASIMSLQKWLDPQVPTFPELRVTWGSWCLGLTNRSFSSPRQMDVDTVWQWHMRLWFLIIVGEEADGHGLSGWERLENGGRFTRNLEVPQSRFTFDPTRRWPVFPHGDSFPFSLTTPSTPWPLYVHKKTQACCYGDSCGSGMGRMNLGQGMDWDLEEASEDLSLTLGQQWCRVRLVFNAESRASWRNRERGSHLQIYLSGFSKEHIKEIWGSLIMIMAVIKHERY